RRADGSDADGDQPDRDGPKATGEGQARPSSRARTSERGWTREGSHQAGGAADGADKDTETQTLAHHSRIGRRRVGLEAMGIAGQSRGSRRDMETPGHPPGDAR